ncbi:MULTISPECIES: hypothetical protein [unclassified Beijerinckia]|uniref:hypothetical protein n=1 Tax=unclassified Beijerinckia TaxID=2638183 RepID=UPI00089A7DAD|nr:MULTISPECIES: hypothetical protein [unclassified Beijerinckia]MDH7794124.1 hypothetical protein [Beijerinckia sp. GAS462]SEB53834.1 hypothetical protein SAMN05443249_0390 [Beijerinckia sp. 28-YEA-48]
MRGILAVVFILAAFGAGTARAQQPVPKEELKVLLSTLMITVVFSSSQNSEADACLRKTSEVGKIVCLKEKIDGDKAQYAVMLEKVAKSKQISISNSGLLKGASEAVNEIFAGAKDVREELEFCLKKLVARDQLACVEETSAQGFVGTVFKLPLAVSIATMLESLVQ